MTFVDGTVIMILWWGMAQKLSWLAPWAAGRPPEYYILTSSPGPYAHIYL